MGQAEIVSRGGQIYMPNAVYEAIVAFCGQIAPLADREALVMALGERGRIWPAHVLPDALDDELRQRFGLTPW